jgi:hypothetical protein
MERMEVLLGLKPCEELANACQEKSKIGLEVMEAAVVTFYDFCHNGGRIFLGHFRSNGGPVERQELRKEEVT